MVNAQDWINEKFPTSEDKICCRILRGGGENLEGSFSLSEFINLEKIYLDDNQLTDLSFLETIPNPQKIKVIRLENNNFPANSKLDYFSRFTNLRQLDISSSGDFSSKCNRFGPSFPPDFKKLTSLKQLNISNNDIAWGLENLPSQFSQILIFAGRDDAESRHIAFELQEFKDDLNKWRKEWEYKENKPDAQTFANYVCLTRADISLIRKEFDRTAIATLGRPFYFKEKFQGKFEKRDRIFFTDEEYLEGRKLANFPFGKRLWFKKNYLESFVDFYRPHIKKEDFTNGNVYYEGEIFEKLERGENPFEEEEIPNPNPPPPETLNQARIRAKNAIQVLLQSKQIKPSDLDTNLWNNSNNWETHLEQELLTIQAINQFINNMEQAISSFKAKQTETPSQGDNEGNLSFWIIFSLFISSGAIYIIYLKRRKEIIKK